MQAGGAPDLASVRRKKMVDEVHIPMSSTLRNEPPAAFARRLGVSRQRVHALFARGLPRNRDGSVPVARARRWVEENVDPVRALGQRHAAAGDPRRLGARRRPAGIPREVWAYRDRPVQYGYLLAACSAIREAMPWVASLAVAAGAPLRVAYATAAAVVLTLDECLLRAVVPGFCPPPWDDLTDWPALAKLAGEEVDLEGWRRWAAERFPDPGPEP
jgi:hypothetical protein